MPDTTVRLTAYESAHAHEHATDFAAERGQLWSMLDLHTEIDRFEAMLRASGKTRATVATYVVQAERFVRWLEGNYAPRTRRLTKPYGYRVSNETKSKYDALRKHLEQRSENAVRMTFRQVEEVLGTHLPASARRYHFWWANDRTGNHAQAAAWMRAGRRVTKLDLVSFTVTFVRAERNNSGENDLRRR